MVASSAPLPPSAVPPLPPPSLAYDEVARRRRLELIESLQDHTRSKVIVYFTGDRQNLQTVVAGDAHALIHEHLTGLSAPPTSSTKPIDRITLFLYTSGGITTAAWGLVNLIREFARELWVAVPYKALSAGTLIALGADKILMSKLGQLSPVDPSLNSPYNPTVPNQVPGATVQYLPVSVEAVMGYIKLANQQVGVGGEHEGGEAILTSLTEKVHPLALGDVYRSREQIRALAERLLKMGSKKLRPWQLTKIVDVLTTGLGSHDYLINRSEARTLLGPWVENPVPAVETTVMRLFEEYAQMMRLSSPLNPEEDLSGATEAYTTYTRAAIESVPRFHAYVSQRRLNKLRSMQTAPIPVPIDVHQQTLIKEGWHCYEPRPRQTVGGL